MKFYTTLYFLVFMSFTVYCQPLEFILDMVHNNPGEVPFDTKYNDPYFLRSQGFNGMVPHWHVNCAIQYETFSKEIIPDTSEVHRWITEKASWIDTKLAECKVAGIEVYPFTDFLVFPIEIWNQYADEIKNDKVGPPRRGRKEQKLKPDIQKKRTQELLRVQIAEIFDRFPDLGGLTLRFGETYVLDTPHHYGDSPIRKGKNGITDHITFLKILREEICVKQNKKLFYRTWDFGFGFHNNPAYYLAVTDSIEAHDNLVFSIKPQQGDFCE